MFDNQSEVTSVFLFVCLIKQNSLAIPKSAIFKNPNNIAIQNLKTEKIIKTLVKFTYMKSTFIGIERS